MHQNYVLSAAGKKKSQKSRDLGNPRWCRISIACDSVVWK